jgi:hypothetical protein
LLKRALAWLVPDLSNAQVQLTIGRPGQTGLAALVGEAMLAGR